MTITITALAGATSTSSATATLSAYPAITAANLTLVRVTAYRVLGSIADPTISGGGVSWTTYGDGTTSCNSTWISDTARQKIWRRTSGTPDGSDITVTFGTSCDSIAIALIDGLNANTGAAVQVTALATGTGTAPLATLGAFGSSANATLGICDARTGTNVFTAGTGFTRILNQAPGGTLRCAVEWRNDNDTTVDGTLSSGNSWAMRAIELQDVSATVALSPSGLEATGEQGTAIQTVGQAPAGLEGTGESGTAVYVVPSVDATPSGLEGTAEINDLAVAYDLDAAPEVADRKSVV